LLAPATHPVADEDAVVRELRGLCRADDTGFWMSLLFLGLWPVFEWGFRRVRKTAGTDHAAISGLWDGLLQALERDDLWDRPGVARRLMYVVRQRAYRTLEADRREAEKLGRVAAYEVAGLPKEEGKLLIRDSLESWPAFSNRSPRKDDSLEPEIAALRLLLTERLHLSAAEAELIIRHFVRGETLADLASEYGITATLCRKRCSRAKLKLTARKEEARAALVTLSEPAGLGNREAAETLDDPDGGDPWARPWMN
jgi:DNA-directed RNA polymerase specialized sigma24 family protein